MEVVAFACPLSTTRIGDFISTLKVVANQTLVDYKLVEKLYPIQQQDLPHLSEEARKGLIAKVLPKGQVTTANEKYVIALTEDNKYQCVCTDDCFVYGFHESSGRLPLLKVHKRIMYELATNWRNHLTRTIESGDVLDCKVVDNEIVAFKKIRSGRVS